MRIWSHLLALTRSTCIWEQYGVYKFCACQTSSFLCSSLLFFILLVSWAFILLYILLFSPARLLIYLLPYRVLLIIVPAISSIVNKYLQEWNSSYIWGEQIILIIILIYHGRYYFYGMFYLTHSIFRWKNHRNGSRMLESSLTYLNPTAVFNVSWIMLLSSIFRWNIFIEYHMWNKDLRIFKRYDSIHMLIEHQIHSKQAHY